MPRHLLVLSAAVMVAAAVFALPPQTAQAATINVTPNSADVIANNGSCSLREAVINANNDDQSGSTDCVAGNGDDVIILPAGTYLLAIAGEDADSLEGDLDVRANLEIIGAGASTTIIDANGFERVLDVPQNAVFTISGVTLRNTSEDGLRNDHNGTVNINNVIVEEINSDDSGAAGVDNNSNGTINADNVLIRDMTTTSSRGSGFNNNFNGTMTVTNSVVRDNSFSGQGGGAYNNSGGTFNLTDSLITNNTNVGTGGNATGGVNNNHDGTFNVTNTTISHNSVETSGGNSAGGAYNNSSGSMTIIGSTISNNRNTGTGSNNAGGLNNNSGGTFTVANSTVSDNTTTSVHENSGGGFYNNSNGTVNVTNSTFIDNAGGSANTFFTNSSGNVNLKNTIIATSAVGDNCGTDSTGMAVSLGNNIADDDTCNLTAGGDFENTDPMVGPLLDNGGPTFTHALLEGSDAIDAGDNTACAAAPIDNVDQRGVTRPQDGDGDTVADCDIGAYEKESAQIKVIKKISGRSSDTFDLQIDGVTYANNVGNGGSTSWVGVEPGWHTVGERTADGGTVRGYRTTIACYAGYKKIADGWLTSLRLYVEPGAEVVCTITNSADDGRRSRGSR